MFEIDLEEQISNLEKDREKVLNSYLKKGRTKEEFEKNYKDRFYPTLVYDKEGKLVKKGLFDNTTIIRIE